MLDKHKAGEIVVFMLLLVPEVKLDPPEDGITVLLNKVLFIVALDMTRLPVDVPNIDEGVGLVEGVNVGVLEPVIEAYQLCARGCSTSDLMKSTYFSWPSDHYWLNNWCMVT